MRGLSCRDTITCLAPTGPRPGQHGAQLRAPTPEPAPMRAGRQRYPAPTRGCCARPTARSPARDRPASAGARDPRDPPARRTPSPHRCPGRHGRSCAIPGRAPRRSVPQRRYVVRGHRRTPRQATFPRHAAPAHRARVADGSLRTTRAHVAPAPRRQACACPRCRRDGGGGRAGRRGWRDACGGLTTRRPQVDGRVRRGSQVPATIFGPARRV